jgi:PKD repeat protein
MKNVSKFSWVFYLMLIIPLIMSCKKKTTEPDVIASFTYLVDAGNFKKVAFTNASSGYSSLSWSFGDATSSTEANPVHTYAAAGQFTVKLTATSPGGVTDAYSVTITISDPDVMLTMLVGDVSKTWKLLRSTSTGRYPLEVGPADYSQIWWTFGGNEELGKRPCMLNDEWTFTRAGLKMDFDAKGDYWAEGGVFEPGNKCALTSDPMVGPNGENLSAWGNGSHTFVLSPGTKTTLSVVGLGAYLGLCKAATSAEVKVPQQSVTYEVIKLTDGPVDTLVVQTAYMTGDVPPKPAYWRFVLMHYDNPADEPPIPGNKPNASFTTSISGLAVTFTNTSTDGDTYGWDFGDTQTSTVANPVHTYATQGIYNVTLTVTNSNGSSTASAIVFLGADLATFTGAQLVGAPWKVRAEEKSVFVGPGMGKSDWWSLPKSFMISGAGVDDWTCMPDDQFTFGATGNFSYNTMGSARNDGYLGAPNGCFSDAQIAGSTLGSGFGSCATHTYTVATGPNPTITLTNGAGFVAFLGFYKGYNGIASGVQGGENNGTNPANFGSATNTYQVMGYANTGSKEYLFVSVDITGDHTGGSAWSMILER